MGVFDRRSNQLLQSEIAYYTKLSAVSPDDPIVKNKLGYLYFKIGMHEEASRCCKEAIFLFINRRENKAVIDLVKKSVDNSYFDRDAIEEILSALLENGYKKETVIFCKQLARKDPDANSDLLNRITGKIIDLYPDSKEDVFFWENQANSTKKDIKLSTVPETKMDKPSGELSAVSEEKVQVKAELQEKIKTFEQEISGLRGDKDVITRKLQENVKRYESLKKQASLTEQKLMQRESELNERIASLSSELIHKDKLFTERAEAYKLEKEALRRKIGPLRKMADESQIPHFVDTIAVRESELAETTKTLHDATERIRQIESDLSTLESSYRELEQNRDMVKVQKDTLSAELGWMAEEKAKLEAELKEKITIYEQEIAGLRGNIDAVISRLQEKIKENEKIKKEASFAEHKLTKRESELNEKITFLSNELIHKEELLTKRTDAYTREKEALNGKIISLVQTNKVLEKLVEVRESRLAETTNFLRDATENLRHKEKALTVLQDSYRELEQDRDVVKEELERLSVQLAGLTEEKAKIEASLQEKVTTHEQEISGFRGDIDAITATLQEKIRENETIKEQAALTEKQLTESGIELNAKITSLLNELVQKEELLTKRTDAYTQEKEELNGKVVALDEANREFAALLQEKTKIEAEMHEKIGMLGGDIAEINTRLQEKIGENETITEAHKRENEKMASRLNEAEALINHLESELRKQHDEIAAKTSVSKPERTWVTYVFYTSLLLVSIIGAYTFLIQQKKLAVPPDSNVAVDRSDDQQKKLAVPPDSNDAVDRSDDQQKNEKVSPSETSAMNRSYEDLFNSLNRVTSSENIKFQGTLLTELFIQKQNTDREISRLEFNKFRYFNVTITALNSPLPEDLIKDPVSYISLTDGKRTLSPFIDKEKTRTIYKRNDLVTIIFICAFPKDKDLAHSEKLELLFSQRNEKMRLTWDKSTLKAHKMIH